MAVNFAAMKSLLRDETNKGALLSDAILGQRITDAVLFFEQNNELRNMERLIGRPVAQSDLAVDYPNPLPLPPNIKSIKTVRIVSANDGEAAFSELVKIEAPDLEGVGRGWPRAYWTEGYKWFYLDSMPQEPYRVEFFIHQYTGEMVDGDEPWLFQFGRMAVLAQAMIYCIPFLRAFELAQFYQALVDRQLPVMLKADDEYYWTGTRSRMGPDGWRGDR